MIVSSPDAKQPEYELLYPHAWNIKTGEAVVPTAEAMIDNSRMYDPDKDKGHLVCPECREAKLIHRHASPNSGGLITRDHFAKHKKSSHSQQCDTGKRAAMYPHQRNVDINLAPFFYINSETALPKHPHGGKPKVRAFIPKNMSDGDLPDWMFRVNYARDAFLGRREITSHQLQRRPRLDPANDVMGLIDNLATISENPDHLKESWAIVNRVAFKADKLVLRRGTQPGERDLTPSLLADYKQANNLPPDFQLPRDPSWDKFARHFYYASKGITHPVLIHFKVAAQPQRISRPFDGQYLIVHLEPYELEGQKQLIRPRVIIKDPMALPHIKVGQEFFALAHPYLSEYHGHQEQNFNVNRACDLVPMTQSQFAEYIKDPVAFRKAVKAALKAGANGQPSAIPA